MMRLLSLVLLLCLVVTPASALTMHDQEYTCPIDGNKFTAQIAMSGTSFGIMLDLKPYGPIMAPWPIAQCPNDGMLLYKDFTDQDLAVLRPYVASAEYRNMLKNGDTPYRRMAALEEKLGVPRSMLWRTLLQATWEADGERYTRYAKETMKAIEEFTAVEKDDMDEVANANLVYGELHRRIGEFQKAQKIFEGLRDNPEYAKAPAIRGLITYELELIKAKDAGQYKCPSPKDGPGDPIQSPPRAGDE